MLYKCVDGVEVMCTPEEEANIRALWDFNTKYPKYGDAMHYDGVNAPVFDLNKAKEQHRMLLTQASNIELVKLSAQIQAASDDGLDTSELVAKRKNVRAAKDMDLSPYNDMDSLIASVPDELKGYFS